MKNRLGNLMFLSMLCFLGIGSFLLFARTTYAAERNKERKILYYRNPMNPAVTSLHL